MQSIFKLCVIIVFLGFASSYDVKELQCLVCEATIDEFEIALSKVDPSKKVDVGGYRIDAKGNLHQKSVSQAKSETHLSELLDVVCDRMDDYVRAKWKSSGELTIIKMMTDEGMNPDMSNVNFITDDDLNKSLKYYCELVLEEHEDSIIKYYVNSSENIKHKICTEDSKMCVKTKKSKKQKQKEMEEDQLVSQDIFSQKPNYEDEDDLENNIEDIAAEDERDEL